LVTVGRPSVYLSVRLSHPAARATAAGLLLLTWLAGDGDRLLHGRRSTAAAAPQQQRAAAECALSADARI